MQCAKFERRLQQLLDDRRNVDQDEVLREHSQRCDTCSSLLRAQSQLFAGLRSFPEPSFSQDLGPRVLDQLRIEQRKRTNKRLALAALVTVAAITIALLPLAGDHVRFRPQDERVGGELAIATTAPRQVPENRLTKQESEDIRLVMHQLMLRLSDQRLSMFEPVDQLASGIRPLAITFNFALHTLRRTLPGYSQPETVEPQALHRSFRTSIS